MLHCGLVGSLLTGLGLALSLCSLDSQRTWWALTQPLHKHKADTVSKSDADNTSATSLGSQLLLASYFFHMTSSSIPRRGWGDEGVLPSKFFQVGDAWLYQGFQHINRNYLWYVLNCFAMSRSVCFV